MTLTEIESHLAVGRERSVCVLRRIAPQFPGWVESYVICAPVRLLVELEPHGFQEGGFQFWGTFPALPDLIRACEIHLDLPHSLWSNRTKSGEYPSQTQLALPYALVQEAVANQGSCASSNDGDRYRHQKRDRLGRL